ncbi:MAG: hypothetical protein JW750_05640 [Anaerolineaceae bacterium]|nr:hypothetical protein [Anaerolineaceae bacterium]
MMETTRIKLSLLWTALMLTYLLGDVLRIYSGDFAASGFSEMEVSQAQFLFMAALMVLPIVMVFLSLTLPLKANRWANLILAGFFFIFNLVGLPTYPSLYDQFLIVVGLGWNLLTIWYAWRWKPVRIESTTF